MQVSKAHGGAQSTSDVLELDRNPHFYLSRLSKSNRGFKIRSLSQKRESPSPFRNLGGSKNKKAWRNTSGNLALKSPGFLTRRNSNLVENKKSMLSYKWYLDTRGKDAFLKSIQNKIHPSNGRKTQRPSVKASMEGSKGPSPLKPASNRNHLSKYGPSKFLWALGKKSSIFLTH